MGGWNNPLMPNFFKDYARFVFETFGDRVKEWVTFNEPDKICLGIYDVPHFEPIYGFSEYLCTHSVLRAHAITYRMYDQEYRPKQRGK